MFPSGDLLPVQKYYRMLVRAVYGQIFIRIKECLRRPYSDGENLKAVCISFCKFEVNFSGDAVFRVFPAHGGNKNRNSACFAGKLFNKN